MSLLRHSKPNANLLKFRAQQLQRCNRVLNTRVIHYYLVSWPGPRVNQISIVGKCLKLAQGVAPKQLLIACLHYELRESRAPI